MTAGGPPKNNPVLYDHLLGAITMVVLAATGAGMTWRLGRRWTATEQVKQHRFLRRIPRLTRTHRTSRSTS